MFKNELNKIRYSILQSCFKIKEGHIGSAFSVIEILYVIFKRYFNKKPKNPDEIINLVKKVRFKINQLCNI